MIALFARSVKEDDIPYIELLISKIKSSGMKVGMYQMLFEQIKSAIDVADIEIFGDNCTLKHSDYLFSLGGDGTLLSAAAFLFENNCRTDIPVLGINFGRLGFLTSVGKNELDNLCNNIIKGQFTIENHSLLQWGTRFALNDICLRADKSGQMLDINVFIDEQYLTTYTADGLIIASPTGSTAYSLSCGGPIIAPNAQCLCITPIAPHNLTFRPLIIPDNQRITLEVKRSRSNIVLLMDSHCFDVDIKERFEIGKASLGIKLMRLGGQNFFSAIGNKLMWGKNLLP
ncbi:MAG: NAD(+)/NADH kinase [Bacteroidales bacterium]|jgi:NAD+ kinase|nr:NAD(+)/NADH kinase [Bacteroidales bacterium]